MKNEEKFNIIDFTEKILNYQLSDYQRAVLVALSEDKHVLMGRSCGKRAISEIYTKYLIYKFK